MIEKSPASEILSGTIHGLDGLEQALDGFHTDLAHDQVLALVDAAIALKQRASGLHGHCLELALVWVQEHGPLVCGSLRWEARRAKKVICRNAMATAEAILDQVHGDLGGLVLHLEAQPYKHGCCQRTLGASTFDRLFLTSFDDHLKLIRVDERFLPVFGTSKEAQNG